MLKTVPRVLIALGLVLIPAGQIYSGASIWPTLAVWFGVAVGIGLVLSRWWALLLAAIPYPLGVGAGLITGRYLFLGEAWKAIGITTIVVGLVGIATGVLFITRGPLKPNL